MKIVGQDEVQSGDSQYSNRSFCVLWIAAMLQILNADKCDHGGQFLLRLCAFVVVKQW